MPVLPHPRPHRGEDGAANKTTNILFLMELTLKWEEGVVAVSNVADGTSQR